MKNTVNQSQQVPYAPYRIQTNGTGGQIIYPPSGRVFKLNRHMVNLLNLCDGWHTLKEIFEYIEKAGALSRDSLKTKIEPLMAEMTKDGLIWWRNERIRHFNVPPPKLVYFDVTMRCNLRCAHCGVAAGEALDNELTTEEAFDVVDKMAEAGVESVAFSGGEPLLRNDLFEIAGYAGDRGILADLATNGTLITPEIAQRAAETFGNVQVSLDGSTAEIHDKLRGHKGAFDKTLQGIVNLQEAGVPFMLGCVIHKKNLHDVEAMAQLAASLGAQALRLIHFVPFGRGQTSPELEPDPQDLLSLAKVVRKIRRDGYMEMSEVNFEFLFKPPEAVTEEILNGPISCGGGWSSLTISPEGEVLPCSYFAGMRSESIREKSLAEIWTNSRLINFWRSLRVKEIGGKCAGGCHWLSQCKGGCPAANFAHGAIFKPNVQCFLTEEEAFAGVPIT
ncbi:MAG TPA: radical SAM protein [Desulfobulbus sp.]|nr:radical SAM protein [Desulfobulbus sp.]